MTDARSAWKGLGEQLTTLGGKLGAHYQDQHAADGEQAAPKDGDAIARAGDAVHTAVGAAGAAAKDEAVKADVKHVGRSFLGALDATFQEVSGEIRKAVDRSSSRPGDDKKPQ
jgi:hypothetical protein